MEISREQIIELGKIIGQNVLEKINRYAVTYQPPSSISAGLHESMGEELTAANWYRRRAEDSRKRGDETTARLYEEIAGDEDDHYRQFGQREESISSDSR
jgi:rubrerythrin